jgi:hypothetical protein
VQANPHKLDACFSGCDADLVSRSELLGRSQGKSCQLRASGIARRRTEQAGPPLSWTRVRRAAANRRQPQRAERALAADRAREAGVCARLVENAHLRPDAVNFSAHLVANAQLKRDSVNLSAHLVRNVRVGPR